MCVYIYVCVCDDLIGYVQCIIYDLTYTIGLYLVYDILRIISSLLYIYTNDIHAIYNV